MIEMITEGLIQFGAIGIVLIYFMQKDYLVTPKLLEMQNEISERLMKISIILDERLEK